MLTYVVTADERKVIDGLGVFEAGETKIFGQTDAQQFQRLRGVPLNNDNVQGASVVIIAIPNPVDEESSTDKFEDSIFGSHDEEVN
jgi:hypothetical protein